MCQIVRLQFVLDDIAWQSIGHELLPKNVSHGLLATRRPRDLTHMDPLEAKLIEQRDILVSLEGVYGPKSPVALAARDELTALEAQGRSREGPRSRSQGPESDAWHHSVGGRSAVCVCVPNAAD